MNQLSRTRASQHVKSASNASAQMHKTFNSNTGIVSQGFMMSKSNKGQTRRGNLTSMDNDQPTFSPDPNRKMRLFSANQNDLARSPEKLGRQVQVGNNFIIVYPSQQYPKREVLYVDSDYLPEARLQMNANSSRSQRSIKYDTMLGREAKVITHNRFGPKMYNESSHKRFRVHKRQFATAEDARSRMKESEGRDDFVEDVEIINELSDAEDADAIKEESADKLASVDESNTMAQMELQSSNYHELVNSKSPKAEQPYIDSSARQFLLNIDSSSSL